MKLAFSLAAQADLEAIGDDLARKAPRYATRLIRKLRRKAQEITQFPSAFQRLEGRDAEWLRRRIVDGYLIVYRVETDRVIIVRILHGARDWGAML